MIIEQKSLDVTTQGIDDSDINYAVIESNPIIMDILSNKMYKNKIGTICREILSNAKDACIEAGVTTPIEAHIPTMLEPWFSIKDYGIGLNEFDLVNIYGNYGKSTKRSSNNSIGGFGLGGKTPYIYNNQFTVTAVKDGKKCVYQFFKNKNGMPVNTCLDRCDTNELNSVEIKIAANNSSDFYKFETEITNYCRWLDYDVKCNKQLHLDRPKLTEYDGFALAEQRQRETLIIVGGIPYPISFVQAGFSTWYGGLHGINTEYIILQAKIGEIDLISSREEVEYTTKTIDFIKNVASKIDAFYKAYKKDKTQVWIINNRKPWEYSQGTNLCYGFYIKVRGSKWKLTSESSRVYSKYVLVNSITDKMSWGDICKRVKCDADNICFVDKFNKDSLIELGIDKANIIDYASLPKVKRGKLKKYKVIAMVDGILKTKRVDELEKKILYVCSDRYRSSSMKELFYDILSETKDNLSIVIDDTQTDGLEEYVKNKYGENHNVTYCGTVSALKKLGIINTLTQNKDDGFDKYRKMFNLIKGESVDLSNDFPLLTGRGSIWSSYYYNFSKHEKEDALDYINLVLQKRPKALDNKHLKVLITKPVQATPAVKSNKVLTNSF